MNRERLLHGLRWPLALIATAIVMTLAVLGAALAYKILFAIPKPVLPWLSGVLSALCLVELARNLGRRWVRRRAAATGSATNPPGIPG